MAFQSPTPKQIKSARLYKEILEEIKIRISAIGMGTNSALYSLPPQIVREHCYLNPLDFEMIAMGFLVAHGDIDGTQSRNVQKEWHPQKIMEILERFHSEFYPYTVQQFVEKDGSSTLNIIDPSPLPKKDLLQIWDKCGNFLHRGGLKN
jgi:hypothetical protein